MGAFYTCYNTNHKFQRNPNISASVQPLSSADYSLKIHYESGGALAETVFELCS